MAEQYLNRRCAVEPRLIVVINVHVFHPVDIHRCRTRTTRNCFHVLRVHISRPSNVCRYLRKVGRSVHRMSGFETTHSMTAPGCWAVNFTMQVIAGRVHLSAVKIAGFGMSTFAYAVPLLTYLKSPPAHHPCTLHAPSACPEDEPCEALVMASCP